MPCLCLQLRRKEKLAAAAEREAEQRRAVAAKMAKGSARAASVAAQRQEVAVLNRVKHSEVAAAKVEAVRERATLEEADKVGVSCVSSRACSLVEWGREASGLSHARA